MKSKSSPPEVKKYHKRTQTQLKIRIESAKSMLNDKTRELNKMTMLPKIATRVLIFLAGSFIGTPFSGLPVAVIPFTPSPPLDAFITNGTFTNFTGRACSQAFFSRLLGFTIGPIVRKLLRRDMPQMPSPFNGKGLPNFGKLN
eukprot:gnl/Chilomastix_caulleri/547.p1 GENE.gnl/Chilomastix_caulleri/547~~gnl/Chilomastix_caulleri/547.p1  ORF type:complete len:143 (-),score=12.43 gnl/Chilomastix_caulleri/547:206-634(-)